jgi:hypothetical protein
MICPTGEAKYFCKGDSTPLSESRPTGKSPHGGESIFHSCPGRGAAPFALLRRAGTQIDTCEVGSDQQGRGSWRKRKGIARVRLSDGSIHVAELHWYEAAGIGRKEFKIKHLL